ncbi:MAG: heavy metal translocating P-type ATPase [Candidatus Viridilinea halotolerans]|uniref:Heavy metal translocating P-type ATPase n=1 Tax=Candidatus Viridilinea halotolerans TaxID=2491704 RepID=A0A426U3K5_9CHLR|nr:MAG: heavy metal translocating P-type ATPase [Candidatus Viridilinea halotolerans]
MLKFSQRLRSASWQARQLLRDVGALVADVPVQAAVVEAYTQSADVVTVAMNDVQTWAVRRNHGLRLVVQPAAQLHGPPVAFSLWQRRTRYLAQWGLVPRWRLAGRAWGAWLRDAEERYQQWVHDTIDPLFGKDRYHHLRALSGGRAADLTPVQRRANNMLAWGGAGAGLSLGALALGLPFGAVSLGFGLVIMYPGLRLAYQRAVHERKLSYIHIGILYGMGMYATGHLALGAMGILVGAVAYKIAALNEAMLRQQMVQIFGTQPRTVWRLVEGVETEMPFAEVQRGDVLVFDAGQQLPVDGVVVGGAAALDQHMLTGEAQLVDKGVGDAVLAATLVVRGRILVEVREAGTATTAAQIGEMLNRSKLHRLSVEEKALKIADRSLWPMLAVSSAALLLSGPVSALAVIGCNYTLNMVGATPVILLKFLNHSAHAGVLVKESGALERLQVVDTFVFDKTGTLTLEQPHVAALHPAAGGAATEVLRLAAAAEQRQSHPLAKAILAAAAEQHLTVPAVEEASYEIGYGLKVRLQATAGEQAVVHVGSERFLAAEGMAIPSELAALGGTAHERGTTLVWVACNQVVLGAIELAATVRPEAHAVVQALQRRGIRCVIISGDQEAPTRQLAASLGIEEYFASTLPSHKAERVAALKAAGRTVCFVGDGINDAIALREANVSVSLAGATTAAIDTAQVILIKNDLRQLLVLFDLVDTMQRDIKQQFGTYLAWSVLAAGGVIFFNGGFLVSQTLLMASLATSVGLFLLPVRLGGGTGGEGREITLSP